MLNNSELGNMDCPRKFFEYSQSYLEASITLANSSAYVKTFSDSNVVVFLMIHGIELFLKGAILNRSKLHHGHAIFKLANEAKKLYKEPEYKQFHAFLDRLPGQQKDLSSDSLEDTAEPISEIFRYPVNKENQPWNTILSFDKNKFISDIESLRVDMHKFANHLLKSQI